MKDSSDATGPITVPVELLLKTALDDALKQHDKVLDFCYENYQYMWAAKIASILLNCDFRDAKQEIESYRKVRVEVEREG